LVAVTDSCDPLREKALDIGGETELMAIAETVDLKAYFVSTDLSKTGAARFRACFAKETLIRASWASCFGQEPTLVTVISRLRHT
jgi:hypothetical protein